MKIHKEKKIKSDQEPLKILLVFFIKKKVLNVFVSLFIDLIYIIFLFNFDRMFENFPLFMFVMPIAYLSFLHLNYKEIEEMVMLKAFGEYLRKSLLV